MADLPLNTLLFGSTVRPGMGGQAVTNAMATPPMMPAPAPAPTNGNGGFFDNLTAGLSDPLTLMGMQMIGNGGMSIGAPRPMFQGVPQALDAAQTMKLRDEQAKQQQAEREAEQQRRAMLAQAIKPSLPANLQSLADIDPESALKIYEQMQPKTSELTANQRDFLFAQQHPEFASMIGLGAPAAEVQQAQSRELLADQYGLTGADRQSFILTGDMAKGGGIPMSPTIQKELFETDDAILASQSAIGSLNRALELSKVAYDGPFAEQRGYGAALFGDRGGQATIELKNEVTTQALSQLKSIFGAAPTEGERKILMDIQGSADQPRAVREAIYQRAIDAANRRLEANRQKAAGLRSGTYFGEGYGAGGSGLGPNGVPEGIDPADWQYMTPEERALWQQ